MPLAQSLVLFMPPEFQASQPCWRLEHCTFTMLQVLDLLNVSSHGLAVLDHEFLTHADDMLCIPPASLQDLEKLCMVLREPASIFP